VLYREKRSGAWLFLLPDVEGRPDLGGLRGGRITFPDRVFTGGGGF